MTAALLLSCDSFESFFGHVLGLDRDRYLNNYRNDWAWYYSRGLIENGVRPILYVPSLHETGLHMTDVGIAVRFLPLARWYKPMARFRRACRATRWSLYAQERVNAMAMMRPLRESIAQDKADLLYVQEHWGGRFDHVVHRVATPVSSADHGGVAAGVVHWFKRAAFKKAAVSYGQTDDECRLIEAAGGRAEFLPNGCDVAEFCPDPHVTRDKTILTVARLTDKQKRTSDLIRAMTQLDKGWSLDIVGRGPAAGALATLAATLGVSDRVRFHGFLSRHEVRDALRRCGVYAMPSANEAVCLALLEAMGCGASVVVSRIRAFVSLIEDGANGRLTDVADVDGIVAAIQDAWERRDAFGRAAVETVRTRYNTRTLYRQLADSMRACVGARAGADESAGVFEEAGAVA